MYFCPINPQNPSRLVRVQSFQQFEAFFNWLHEAKAAEERASFARLRPDDVLLAGPDPAVNWRFIAEVCGDFLDFLEDGDEEEATNSPFLREVALQLMEKSLSNGVFQNVLREIHDATLNEWPVIGQWSSSGSELDEELPFFSNMESGI